nr:hypothetical protein [Treponema sp.]
MRCPLFPDSRFHFAPLVEHFVNLRGGVCVGAVVVREAEVLVLAEAGGIFGAALEVGKVARLSASLARAERNDGLSRKVCKGEEFFGGRGNIGVPDGRANEDSAKSDFSFMVISPFFSHPRFHAGNPFVNLRL